MSAIRMSPPSSGPIHNGKTIGVDEVEYNYKQASLFVDLDIYLLTFL